MDNKTNTATAFAATADRILMGALMVYAAATVGIAAYFGDWGLGVVLTALLLAAGVASVMVAAGSTWTRMLLAVCLSSMVALQIDMGRGISEFHFGVFVTLALLLVYRDWRPIVLSAAFFAVHHVVVDRLQALGWGVYCMTEPSFIRVLMHAGYVVLQTGLEVFMAIWLSRVARVGEELGQLVQAIESDGVMSLDMRQISVETPEALALKSVLARMNAALLEIQQSASSIQTASSEIAAGTNDLSLRTEQTASSLQEAASSMVQLTGTVSQTASSASQATGLAANAAELAGRGGSAVEKVVDTMGAINGSSRKIVDIISVIDGIAFQTNILALNAAVEAARAGEQGRGFAVVASEVRSLAQRSAGAAKEIKGLIDASVQQVEAGAALVNTAGTTMTDIVGSVRNVSQIIAEISAASNEQSQGIGLVNSTVGQLEQMTQQNAAMVEQSGAAADSLREQANALARVLLGFRLAPA